MHSGVRNRNVSPLSQKTDFYIKAEFFLTHSVAADGYITAAHKEAATNENSLNKLNSHWFYK
jgi:hypothetical protein